MSFIQNFYTSRDNNTDGNTYVGQEGRLWYNPNTNSIYVNTANIAGGTPVDLATGANIVANNITTNTLTSTSGTIALTGNITITGNISAASTNKIGGVAPGPGVNISNIGILTIDSANLPVSFGNFYANNNILSIVNVDEDMILATQGNATIKLVGNVEFVQTNGPPGTGNIFINATNDGFMTIYAPTIPANAAGALNIVGSTNGDYQPVRGAGGMLHITGNDGIPARMTSDAFGTAAFPSYVGRAARGTAASPSPTQSGDVLLRFSALGWAEENYNTSNTGGPPTSIDFVATDNYTHDVYGSKITFYTSPQGSIGRNLSLTVDSTGVSTGNVVATGNITGGNLITAGNISAGNVISYVTLPAGTTTNAPLRFTAGNLLSSAAPGVMSYDGKFFYATPQGAERGLINTQQIYILNTDYALTNQTGVQSMYGVSASVSTNTRYAYVINAVVYKTDNNITMSFAIDGNAVLSSHTYQTSTTASTTLATLSTPSVLKNSITSGFTTPVVVTAALNSTGYYSLQVTGVISVTTGGTWNPLIAFSGLPGAGSLVLGGSQVEIWPVGVANTTVSIGSWA